MGTFEGAGSNAGAGKSTLPSEDTVTSGVSVTLPVRASGFVNRSRSPEPVTAHRAPLASKAMPSKLVPVVELLMLAAGVGLDEARADRPRSGRPFRPCDRPRGSRWGRTPGRPDC